MSGGPPAVLSHLSLAHLVSADRGLVSDWLKVGQLASRCPPIGWSWGNNMKQAGSLDITGVLKSPVPDGVISTGAPLKVL